MNIVVVDIPACQLAHDRSSIEHGVLCHTARRLIEAHGTLAFLRCREGDGLDLDDGAEESGDTESEHSADGRCIGGLLSAELMEAAHLCDLIDISSCHLERRCFCFT